MGAAVVGGVLVEERGGGGVAEPAHELPGGRAGGPARCSRPGRGGPIRRSRPARGPERRVAALALSVGVSLRLPLSCRRAGLLGTPEERGQRGSIGARVADRPETYRALCSAAARGRWPVPRP